MACGNCKDAYEKIEKKKATLQDVNVAICCVREQIEGIKPQLDNLKSQTKGLTSSLGSGFKSVGENIKNMGKEMIDFTKNTEKQYTLAY
jgi:hypothetical protein